MLMYADNVFFFFCVNFGIQCRPSFVCFGLALGWSVGSGLVCFGLVDNNNNNNNNNNKPTTNKNENNSNNPEPKQ